MSFLTHLFPVSKPNYHEKKQLGNLQKKFFTQFDDNLHGVLMQSLYSITNARLSSASLANYEIVGTSWRRLGFTQENPRFDLSEGGELVLECLLYFLQNYRTISLQILNNRIRKDDFDKLHYPWAAIGIKLACMLSSIIEIYEPVAKTFTDCCTFKLQPFWHFIVEKNGFFRMFSSLFMLYDVYWSTIFQDEFIQKKYNFQFGINLNWELAVWSYHDTFLGILNRCENLNSLEELALQTYAQSLLELDDDEEDILEGDNNIDFILDGSTINTIEDGLLELDPAEEVDIDLDKM